MHTQTAFARREALSDNDLERLRIALTDEVARYREAIRGYSAEKMATHGQPFLQKLEERVTVVEGLQARRSLRAPES